MPLSVGVIGTGMIVERGHLPGLKAQPACEIVAIAGRNEPRLRYLSEAFGIDRYYTGWRQMIREEQLDAVTIATPPFLHAEMGVEAMSNGLDVLIEKPLASTLDDVNLLVKAERESGRIAMVEQTLRYNPTFQEVAAIISSGVIGELIRAHGALLNRGPRSWAPESTWFFDPELSGGGLLLDSGVHIIDLLRHLAKEDVVDLNGELVFLDEEGIEEEASLTGWLSADTQISANLSWHVDPPQVSVTLFGTNGYLHADAKSPIPISIHRLDGSVTHPQVHRPTWFGATYQHFVDCCLNRSNPLSSIADNKHTIEPLLKIYQKQNTIRRRR